MRVNFLTTFLRFNLGFGMFSEVKRPRFVSNERSFFGPTGVFKLTFISFQQIKYLRMKGISSSQVSLRSSTAAHKCWPLETSGFWLQLQIGATQSLRSGWRHLFSLKNDEPLVHQMRATRIVVAAAGGGKARGCSAT